MGDDIKSDLEKLFEISSNDENILTVSTTVDTGLEWLAVDECKEKLNLESRIIKDRGRIYFNIPLNDFPKVRTLRSVDNIFIVSDIRYATYDPEDNEKNLATLRSLTESGIQVDKSVRTWKQVTGFVGKVFPTREEYLLAIDDHKLKKSQRNNEKSETESKHRTPTEPVNEDTVLLYRVTCERNGTHTFSSPEAAREIGGAFHVKYNWIVELDSYNLEIVCKVTHGEVITYFRVTPESLHRRNIKYFGPTTLRATVCYNLLRLVKPKPGDIIIDPMCGGGSIPIEAAINYPQCFILGGDNHIKAVERSKLNFNALPKSYHSDILQWSVKNLPYKDEYVDAFVTDAPFGKRMGSQADNRILYKHYLMEIARVLKLRSGRLVLLTYDRRSIGIAMQATKDLLFLKRTLNVNMGGLSASAYVLKRTSLAFQEFQSNVKKIMKIK